MKCLSFVSERDLSHEGRRDNWFSYQIPNYTKKVIMLYNITLSQSDDVHIPVLAC